MTPAKLLFLIKSMNAPGGGAERVLSLVTSELANRGHEVTLATFDPPGAPSFYAVDEAVERLHLAVGQPRSRATAKETLQRVVTLRREITKRRPDVAIGFMHSGFIPLAISLAGSRIPVIASEHVGWGHYAARPMEAALLRATSPLYSAITMISEGVAADFPATVRRKATVITNPIWGSSVSDDATPIVRRDDAGAGHRLLCVGRLEDDKNHDTLIAAFSKVAARFPQWTLRIVGEGHLRDSLEKQIRALGLTQRVELPGATSDIAAEYRSADLFVIPSLRESFGMVTAEALSFGLPAIGFVDCPGTNELIVDHSNGLLAAAENREEGLAEAMGRLMASAELRMMLGANGPSSVAQFRIEPVVDLWEELIRAVMARRR